MRRLFVAAGRQRNSLRDRLVGDVGGERRLSRLVLAAQMQPLLHVLGARAPYAGLLRRRRRRDRDNLRLRVIDRRGAEERRLRDGRRGPLPGGVGAGDLPPPAQASPRRSTRSLAGRRPATSGSLVSLYPANTGSTVGVDRPDRLHARGRELRDLGVVSRFLFGDLTLDVVVAMKRRTGRARRHRAIGGGAEHIVLAADDDRRLGLATSKWSDPLFSSFQNAMLGSSRYFAMFSGVIRNG